MANNMAMVSDIFHSSQEQHQALSQMAPNVERIASMTEQNLTVVNHTNATVNRLNDMVVRLQKCVAQYSI
jgi:methyl-accepting chemotaxis protein